VETRGFSKEKLLKWLAGVTSGILIGVTVFHFTNPEERPYVESLPNGDYIFGLALRPHQQGSTYVIFRKYGDSVVGVEFQLVQSDNAQMCFYGWVEFDDIFIEKYTGWGKDGPFTIYHISHPEEEFLKIELEKFKRFSPKSISKHSDLFEICYEMLRNKG
jgi:hypothetical protein